MIQNLLDVWESSIKVTHLFLSVDEINNIKQYAPQALQGVQNLMVAENEQGKPIGFMEIHEQMMEMLFVSAQERGKSVGKKTFRIWDLKFIKGQSRMNQKIHICYCI